MNNDNQQTPVTDKLITQLKTDKDKFFNAIKQEKNSFASVIRNSETFKKELLSGNNYFKNALDKIDNDRICEQLETISTHENTEDDASSKPEIKCFTGYVDNGKEKKISFFDKFLKMLWKTYWSMKTF